MKITPLLVLAFTLALPMQAGVDWLKAPARPTAAAVARSLEEQMLDFARHNAGLHQMLDEPDISALLEGEQDEAACQRALQRFKALMQAEASGQQQELHHVLTPLSCVYALQPGRRAQLARFLRESLAQSPCREFCLWQLLRGAVLSPANKELCEALFGEFSFSPLSFERTMVAQEALPSRVPAGPGNRLKASHMLLRACLDLDSPAIAARLLEQGALVDSQHCRGDIEAYQAGKPYTPGERAEAFAEHAQDFLRNNSGPVWPGSDFLRRARLERGMDAAWAELPWRPEPALARMRADAARLYPLLRREPELAERLALAAPEQADLAQRYCREHEPELYKAAEALREL